MRGECIVLGCGNSCGVPVLGCNCAVCRSTDPRNRRSRPSLLIRCNGTQLLIDAGPDIRLQLLRENISEISGLFITHSHYDHTGGLDDLRILAVQKKLPLPVWLGREAYEDIELRLRYLVHSEIAPELPFKRFLFHPLTDERGAVQMGALTCHYFPYRHADVEVLGLRVGDLAYVTDIRHYDERIFSDLEGIETLIISALRIESSPLHFSVSEAIDFGQRSGAKRLFLTHLAHEVGYEEVLAALPANASLCVDGLRLPFTYH